MPRAKTPRLAVDPAAKSSLQCFLPGRHVTMTGHVLEFAESDLQATASAYDPKLREAPLVVGHPTLDGPAYGWVKRLAHEGGALEAEPHQVEPAFAELVNAGRYKQMSAAFWGPDAPGNPVPGVYYLKHIGFLGATAPAVAGLRTPQFAAGDDEGVVVFSEWDDTTNAGLWRRLREWILGKFGKDAADEALPSFMVASLESNAAVELAKALPGPEAAMSFAAAADAGAAPPITDDQEAHVPQTLTTAAPAPKAGTETAAELQAENARLKAQIAERDAAARTDRLATAHAAAVEFATGLVSAGKLPEGRRDVVVALLDVVAQHTEASGSVPMFAQGDTQVPLAAEVKRLLTEQLPELVTTARVATAARAAGGGAAGEVAAFAAPAGYTVDPAAVALDLKARQYMAQHADVDYVTAVKRVGGR